jgi:ketosteroid isomerase-like protein
MSDEKVAVAHAFYEAFLVGDDPSSAEPFVEPDFEFVPSPRIRILFPTPSHGLDEFYRRLRELANQFESYEAVPERFIDAGDDRLVALLHRTTKSHGVRVEDRIAHLITVRGGRISRIVGFANLEEALEAAGLSE